MKQRKGRIIAIQAALVLLMSAAASYCLVDIGVMALLVFAGFIVVGAAMIFFPRVGTLPFSLLVFIASLPAILSHNILDLGTFMYTGPGYFAPRLTYADLSPEISFTIALGIGSFIITGYLTLSYLHSLQKDYRAMTSGNAEINEVQEVMNRNLSIIAVVLAISVVVSAIVVVLLRIVQPPVANYLKDYPWSIIVFGLAAVLLLAGFLYWMGASRQKTT